MEGKARLPMFGEIPRTTNELIGRDNELREILTSLDKYPIVIVEGHRGVGKTALAFHVLHQLTKSEIFGALVWVTAAATKSEFFLANIFDAISKTIDYPFSAQTEVDDKEKILVDELELRSIKCLLLIDNFETVSDPEVKKFLFERLPKNLTVLITSKQKEDWPNLNRKIITLEDLDEKDTLHLFEYLVERDSAEIEPREDLNQLYQAVGGSPLAVEWVLGQVRKGQTLPSILTLLQLGKANILSEVFENSWTMISEHSRQVLRVMTVFVKPPSEAAMKFASGLSDRIFPEAIRELSQMYLIKRLRVHESNEIPQKDDAIRFFIHPFTRDYVEGRLSKQAKKRLFSSAAKFYLLFVSDRGGTSSKEDRNDNQQLNSERPNLLHVINGCGIFKLDRQLIDLVEAMARWMFIESHWHDLETYGNKAVVLAESINMYKPAGRITNEIGRVYTYKRQYAKAEETFDRAIKLAQQSDPVDLWAIAYIKHHKGEAKLRQKNFEEAKVLLKESYLGFASLNSIRDKIGVNYRLAVLMFDQGGDISEAKEMFEKGCDEALGVNWDRLEGFHRRYLGDIYLKEKEYIKARIQLERATKLVPSSDMRIQAFLELSFAKLETEEGRIDQGLDKAKLAMDHFKKLGMINEEDEAGSLVKMLQKQISSNVPFIANEARKMKRVFISYSHDDISFRDQADKFLINLKRNQAIEIWHDGALKAGDKWDETILRKLIGADIIILLISQSFISSTYVFEKEMKYAMENVNTGKARIIPFLLSNCDWENWNIIDLEVRADSQKINNATNSGQLRDYQFLPQNEEQRLVPLIKWNNPEDGWMQLVRVIKEMAASPN